MSAVIKFACQRQIVVNFVGRFHARNKIILKLEEDANIEKQNMYLLGNYFDILSANPVGFQTLVLSNK